MLQLLFVMYSLILTTLHDLLCNLLISFPPYNAIISNYSLSLELFCMVDDILNELKKGPNVETTNYIVFFKGFKNMEIHIGFNVVEDLTHF
jgi:hypothetical protein